MFRAFENMETTTKIKLNLASGKDYREGYINVDNQSMFPDCKVDLNADILTMNYEENSVDEILLSHFVMYVRPMEMNELIKKLYSWLKFGGKLTIETIDFEKVLKEALNGEKRLTWGDYNIFGTEETSPHGWGWRRDTLLAISMINPFREANFAEGSKKPNRDFILELIK